LRTRLLAIAALVLLAACAHAPRSELEPRPGVTEPEPRGAIAEGLASYYGAALRGRPTANGERFDPSGLTAAHRTLPFGTCLRVENLGNHRFVEVRVNDRGPFVKGRIVDVSEEAARRLDLIRQGVARVRLFFCGA
jgi:rare lipoprotein A